MALELAPTLGANGYGSPCLPTGLRFRLMLAVSTRGPEGAANSKPILKARIKYSVLLDSLALPYGETIAL